MSIMIDKAKCKGCGMCTSVCPGSLIYQDSEKKAFIKYPKDCWGCASCIKECHFGAIALYLGADIGGMGSLMTVKSTPDTLTWDIKKRDGSKEEILINKKIQIEARVMGDLSMNHIIPVATHYQSQLAKNVENMIDIFGDEEGKKLTARNIKIIKKIAERTQIIETGVEELVNARKVANKIESEHDKAIAYHDTVAPKMEEIRYQIDKLELTVADELWTLPKYRELLFIR